MKYLFLLLFASFMLTLPTALDAQCPIGSVTLSSQADVNNFAANYPNCSQITGFLTISGNDITDLSPLANLSSVGTHLSIVNNAALTSLQGLSNLSSLGSYLSIQYNASLTSLQGLDNLSSLESFFSIENNAALTSLQGLNNLSDVATELWIVENNALTSLQGLNNLSSVGTSFSIIENDALTSLQGVENLSSVGDDLFIDDNPALTNIQGLSSLSSLGGDFWIEDNGALTSLNGPNMLTSIGGTLWIGRNDALTSLNGLNNVSSVGGQFSLVFNNALTSLNGLGNLSSIASFIIIGTNPSLTSLNGLESLSSVGTDISIVLNGSLTSITSLSNLSSIGGRLEIRGNNALSSIEGLSSLTSLDRLLISDNEVLTNLQGLENLSSVSNSVDIKNNALLTSLAGLDNLSFTGGYLWIWQNDVLNSISVLNNLTSIGGDLLIGNNPALPSLAGLENISSIGGYLYIEDNDVLTSLQELNNISSVEGYLSINNNDALTSLQGLNNISSVQGYLSVNDNDALTSLQGLNNISSVQGYLSINNNDALTSLQGLNNISSVQGYLSVNNNDALTSLQGLNNISSVQGYLSVNNNDALTSLQGLNNISSVQGYLSVNNNDALTSLQELNNISSVPGYLSVNNNDALTNLQGLNNISSVQGYLSVNDNDALTSLQGLSNISSVPGYLSVNNNDALTNLQGLNNISSVASDLRIENNGALTSLQELNNLSSVGGELRITDNPTLSTCSIDWICDNIYFPYQIMIISNNATGCNSKDEVEDDCPNLYEPVCQNTTVALLSDGTASITPSEVDGGSIDVASSFVFPSDFTCEELGANIVSLVVIDIAGNVGACDATVTVEDPNDFCPGCATYTATDNPQPVPVFGSGTFDCSSATTSTIDVDLSGQIGVGLTDIDYVEIDITHTFTGDLILELRAPSGASITLSSENGSSGNNYTGTRFEDGFPSINSANAPFTGTFEPEQGAFNDVLAGEEIHGTWTLYICDDAGGDIGTLNLFTLKICSTDAPASPSITCPPDQMGSFDTDCQYSIPDYRSLATVSNFIGSSPTITQSPPPGTQINGSGGSLNQLITITAADAVGNSSDCTFNLTVNDDIPPTISCPADVTQTVDAGQTYATVVDIAPASSDDNCASPTSTHTISGATTGSGGADASGTQFNIGSSEVTYTVTDAAGLIGNCSFTVDVSLDCGSILVNSTADNLTPGDGNCTLREAIRNVNAGSDLTSGDCNCGTTITFDASTNGTSIVLSIAGTDEDAAATGDLDITADVTITGNGSGNTIINGNDIDRVFHLPPAAASLNVTLEHLTVKDGLLTGSNFGGGGLNSDSNNANLIISNCAFESNQASRGGGLGIESASTVEIDNCLFNGNIASESHGGGVSLSIGAYTIRNCFFQNNQADVRGGGATTHSGAYTFINCTMTGNTATNGGGAIENSSNSGSVTLTNCTIAENTSINGAAVDINNNNAFLSLTNNIIVNNISSSDLKIVGVSPQVNVQNIVESCSISCPTFFSTSDDVICGLSTCANGLSYYPVIPNSDADGTADTSTPLADDICGNSRSTSSYNIGSSELFFTDNESPTAMCQNITVQLDANGNAALSGTDIDNGSTDNCGVASFSAEPNAFTCDNVGTNSVTLTVTDDSNNDNTCTATVTVQDTDVPTAICQNITIQLDADGNAALSGMDIDNGSTDNCGVASFSAEPNAFTCDNVGTNSVTLTVTDDSNNDNTCTATVTVQDTEAPVVTCNDFTVFLDASGEAFIPVGDLGSTTDNCGGLGASSSPSFVDCNDVGQVTSSIVATDNAGNQSSCNGTITVVDNLPPAISCPADVTQTVDAGQTYATVVDIAPASSDDNCASPTITHTISGATTGSGGSDASGTQFNVGSSVVTYTIEDASNNTASCSFNVEVNGNAEIDVQDPGMNSLTSNISNYDFGNVDIMGGSASGTFTINNIGDVALLLDGSPTVSISGSASFSVFQPSLTTIAPAGATTFQIDYNPANGDCSQQMATVSIANSDPDENPFTLTVSATPVDNIDPVANCPTTVGVDNDTNACGANVSFTIPGASDNCPGVSSTAVPASGSFFDVGTTQVTVTATDAVGNTSQCTFDVVVNDTENPTANCPATQTVSNDPGECGAVVSFSIPGPADNCAGATASANMASGSFFDVGTTEVTVTATDAAGNTSQCTFDVVVNDTENPVANCPATQTVSNDPGECGAVVSFSIPDPADNCAGATASANTASGSFFDAGTTEVTVTATDAVGNTSQCTFDVVVNDTENPVANCPADITVNAEAGQPTADVSFSIPSPSDNCTGATAQADFASGSAFPLGQTTVTVTATDASNNSSSCTFSVTVNDAQAPTANCPGNITVDNTAGLCGASVSFTVPEPTDNAPGATASASPAPGSFFDVGTTQVTITATDANSNSSQCTFEVTVNDTENPVANCPSTQTVSNDAGECGAIVSFSVPEPTDNCSATTSASPASGSFFDVGTTQVTVTATDATGNTSQCTFDVVVNDTENPTANCPATQTVSNDPGECGAVVSFSIPGPADNCAGATASANMASGSFFDVGTTEVTVTATDAAGNTSQCTFDLVVNDTENPTANCPGTQTVSNDPGECGAVVSFSIPDPADNCAGATASANMASGSFFDVGTTPVTVTATDATGNTSQCTFDLVVNDTENPVANCPADITVNAEVGQPTANVSFSIPSPSDNCTGATAQADFASGAAFPLGQTTVTVTATDASDNTGNCTFSVTVNDAQAPIANCPENITVDNAAGQCGASVSFTVPEPTDNAPGATASASPAPGTFFDVGTTEVTVTATDANDNSSTCTFEVTVNDTENPIVNCPGTQTVSNDAGECGADVSFSIPDPADNCAGVTASANPASGSFFDVGTTQVTVTATDAAGNTSQCTFDVVVNDTENPVANCPGTQTVSNDAGECGANVSFSIPVPTDNCPATSSASPAPGSFFDVGTTQVTVTATDATGNTSQCTFDVVVNDTENPVANCPGTQTVSNDPGECGANVNFSIPEPADNCAGATASSNLASGSFFDVGTTQVTVTATDAAGNTSQCTFDVVVNDTEDPVANCPSTQTASNDPGECGAIVSFSVPSPADNCAGATASSNLASGSFFDVGTMQVIVTATDAVGNTNQCTFDVVVNDTEKPVVNCPADITVNAEAGQPTADVSFSIPSPSDNCTGTTAQADIASGAAFPLGQATVTVTATDASGNTGNCIFSVTVNDAQAPTANCPENITVDNAAGQCGANVSFTVPEPTDNAPGATASASPAPGTFFDVGTTEVTVTATDASGNTSQCTFEVTVNDTENPTVACPSTQTVSNDAGECGANVNFSIPDPADNCAGVTASANPASGSFFDVGTTEVAVTATDAAGNTGQCTFDVVVNDVEAPVPGCPADIIQANDPGMCGAVANYTLPDVSDNCPGATQSASMAADAVFSVGTTKVMVTATDAADNSASCTFDVTVNDTEAPDMACQNATVEIGQELSPAQIDGGSTDNCAIAQLSVSANTFGCADVGDNTVTLTASDAVGNISSCTATVTVLDNNMPTAVCADITADIEASEAVTLAASDIDGGAVSFCGNSLDLSIPPTTFDCNDLGSTVSVTLTVTDNGNGLTDQCTANVTVADPNSFCCAPPAAMCDNITVQLDASGNASITPAEIGSGSTAECGLASQALDIMDFDCSDVGGNTVTYTLVDINGDIDNCTSTVTVEDNVSPIAICQDVIVPLHANGDGSTTAAAVDNGSSDACGTPSLSLSQTSFGCGDVGSVTVTLTVTDNNGNTDECTATVTVTDNTSPVAACLSTTVELQSDGTYTLQEGDVYDAGNSSDNCSIAMVSFPPTNFSCADLDLAFPVTVTVADPSGNTDDCTATVSVAPNTALPGGWGATDIGNPGDGSDYGYDPCAGNNPGNGDLTISTGGYNLFPQNADNLAFASLPLCGNGGIQARIESVSGGYAGLMIRESSAPGAKMVAVYSNLTNLLRREIRTVENGQRSSSTSFAAFPKWLRLVRQGNYIQAFHRSSNGGNWTLFHQAYLPMGNCVEMGLAVFTTDPGGDASAVFGSVNYQSQGGQSLSTPNTLGWEAETPKVQSASVLPNPVRNHFTLQFSKPLPAEGQATLLNEFGQRIAQQPLRAGERQVDWDAGALPAGLYFLEVLTEDGYREVLKVVRQ